MLPKDDVARKIDTINFEYILPEGSYTMKKTNGASKANGNKESKSKLDEYREGLRDYQNAQISKLGKLSIWFGAETSPPLFLAATYSNEIRYLFCFRFGWCGRSVC